MADTPPDDERSDTLVTPLRPKSSAAPVSLVGQVLGEYVVEALLGAGGMGVVYRGVQPQIGKRVAIKVLKPEFANGEESIQALLAEARAVNAIRHPGIVDIFSFGSTPDGAGYVVMELLEGESLEAILRKVHRFAPVEAISILSQMLIALDAAHSAGVIHRDLKPANVHLARQKDGSWLVKILDFGLAKVMQPGASMAPLTHSNVVCGTPHYMAPEQARALPVSPRTDLYAIGIIAFELLTGQRPFESNSLLDLLMQQVSAPPPPLRTIDASLPPPFEELILRLLAKDPSARPGSALEVQRELQQLRIGFLAAATVTVTPAALPPEPGPATGPLKARSLLAAALVMLGAALVGGVGVLLLWPASALPGAQSPAAAPSAIKGGPAPITPPPITRDGLEPPPEPVPTLKRVTRKVIKQEAIKEVPMARAPPPGRSVDEVIRLLGSLEADAQKRPPIEARSRLAAFAEYRDALAAGRNPDDIWAQLQEY